MVKALYVSVIMSVYKEPKEWLCQSIDSILNQTLSDFEFIIICDNPAGHDNLALLRDYERKNERIKLIVNEENIGLTKSLNKGLAVAKGRYIARMDADDISTPTRFESQYQYMEANPQVNVLGTAIKYFGRGAWKKGTDGIRYTDEDIRAQMLLDNCIAHPTVFIRKSVLDEHGLTYDENYRQSQDIRLWEQLMPYGEFANLKEKLLKYRLSDQQITKSRASSQSNLAEGVKLRLQLTWLQSLGYNYTIGDIKDKAFVIIDKIREDNRNFKNKNISAFVQNAYLNYPCEHKIKRLFGRGDYKHFTLMNLVRVLIK